MSEEQPKAEEKVITEEELKASMERKAKEAENGSNDMLSAMVGYAKRYNGFPYISASRVDRIPGKEEKHSILFDQLLSTFLLKNIKNPKAIEDFQETFGRGDLVYIQAHADCPTMAADGLYNAIDINGKPIKTQLIGYFKIVAPDPEVTEDEKSEPEFDYFYKDQNDEFMNLFVNDDTPLAAHRAKYTTIYKAPRKVPFTSIILRKYFKDGKTSFGVLTGDPFHGLTRQEIAALLKDQADRGNLTVEEGPTVQTSEPSN